MRILKNIMIFNKLHNAMTLMDVMFALAIAGTVLTPILISQGSAMDRIKQESQAVKRLFLAQQFFYDVLISQMQGEQVATTKEHVNPPFSLVYKESTVSEKSALSRFSDIGLCTVSWQWQEQREQRKDQFISIVYKRKEKEA